jgi:GDSL-like Lipase/Acylhydrolase
MVKLKKSIGTNMCISLIASSLSFLLGYSLYTYTKKPQQVLHEGTKGEYYFSFYNQRGQKISELDGMLKLMTDPFTIYTNYPTQKSSSYSINKYGFRDGYSSDKPYTAMVLGGSAAFGFALDNNNGTFASKMSQSNKKYNVINSAVIGFLSGQELSQMVHYLDNFKPSLYIVFDGWNDIYDPYLFAKSWPVSYGPIGFHNVFFMVENRLAEYFRLTQKDKNLKLAILEKADDLMSEKEYFEKIQMTYISNIDKMKSFANSRGASFLHVFQPELGNKRILSKSEQEILSTWNNKYGYRDNHITEKYRELIRIAKVSFLKRNIIYIDINEEVTFSENSETLFFDVIHPNELGHEIIAKIINQALLDKF